MKYKKGAKVEVLNKREVPSGSWWCAEIISGNGHTYSVMYDPSPPGTSGLVERVPRKVIRPCPPLVEDLTYWVSGDIVEILDNASWKLAEVLSAVDESYFLVRLLGSARAFKVYKSNLRHRQCWQGSGWVVIGKDVRSSEDGGLLKEGFHGELNYQKSKGFMQNCEQRTAVENDRESSCVPSGIKKRGLRYCSAIPESCCRVNKKLKAGDKEGTYQQLAVVNLYQSQQKARVGGL
uniref:Calpain-8 n=1 Tax=Anthurium amnicola TaxID=1678845 RepID=A0A1D1XM92_9ARAE